MSPAGPARQQVVSWKSAFPTRVLVKYCFLKNYSADNNMKPADTTQPWQVTVFKCLYYILIIFQYFKIDRERESNCKWWVIFFFFFTKAPLILLLWHLTFLHSRTILWFRSNTMHSTDESMQPKMWFRRIAMWSIHTTSIQRLSKAVESSNANLTRRSLFGRTTAQSTFLSQIGTLCTVLVSTRENPH